MNQMDPIFLMPDIQSSIDTRQIPIQRVGIRSVRYPMSIRTAHGVQPTVGVFGMDVYLPAEKKGTHMSRFLTVLEECSQPLDLTAFRGLLAEMLVRLEANAGRIEVVFPYFIKKAAPVTAVESLMDYEVSLIGEVRDGITKLFQKVVVPVSNLCPCSKEISRYGAHNQRSHVTICAELASDLSIDSLIRIAEEEASCELWGLLKRPDEKYVTERAYDNPKFVEDLVRGIAVRLNQEPAIAAYVLEAENFESIHNHSAYAVIECDKRLSLEKL